MSTGRVRGISLTSTLMRSLLLLLLLLLRDPNIAAAQRLLDERDTRSRAWVGWWWRQRGERARERGVKGGLRQSDLQRLQAVTG